MPNAEFTGDVAHPRHLSRKAKTGLAAAAMLALGGIGGAAVVAQTRPSVTMAPVTPVAIRSLSSGGMGSSGIVTIRGQVAEVYGNKFVLADASGRALVDTGRRGEDGTLVTAGEPVLVQGRFERGFVHAAFLVGADKSVVALGPLDGPHGGPGGRHGPEGHGPAMPPPPPGADGPGAPPPMADRDAPPPPPAVPNGAVPATTGTK